VKVHGVLHRRAGTHRSIGAAIGGYESGFIPKRLILDLVPSIKSLFCRPTGNPEFKYIQAPNVVNRHSGSHPPLDDTIRMAAMCKSATTGLCAALARLAEPQILFPALTVLVLAVILGTTVGAAKCGVSSNQRSGEYGYCGVAPHYGSLSVTT
jgi:hypothetical protein